MHLSLQSIPHPSHGVTSVSISVSTVGRLVELGRLEGYKVGRLFVRDVMTRCLLDNYS